MIITLIITHLALWHTYITVLITRLRSDIFIFLKTLIYFAYFTSAYNCPNAERMPTPDDSELPWGFCIIIDRAFDELMKYYH